MKELLNKWCDTTWIIFLCVAGVLTATLASIFWDVLPLGAKGGVFAAIIMPFHVLEEWKFPGGLHYFYNVVFAPRDARKRNLNRYPMSRLTDMITNVGLQWIPLIYAVLCYFTSLSNAVALSMMLLCLIEVAAHTGAGILTYFWLKPSGKKTIYHPGFATSWMLFFPAGIYLATRLDGVFSSDWLWCGILFVIMLLICIPLTETPLKKWVSQQEAQLFAFEDAKYYKKYPSFGQTSNRKNN